MQYLQLNRDLWHLRKMTALVPQKAQLFEGTIRDNLKWGREDAADGDLRVTIVGKNQAGFELAFAKDAETVIDAEFTAFANDNEGTLIQIDETLPQLSE